MSMTKCKLLLGLSLLFSSYFTVFSQTPQAHLNSGVPATGTTGTITVTFSSVTANHVGSFTYNPAQPVSSQTLFLSTLPVANDYVVKVSNATNLALSYFMCQAPRGACDPTLTRSIACESLDNPTVDGTSSAIPAGVLNFIVAQNFKIINNVGNGTTCPSNAGTAYDYITGAIYLTLFPSYTNSLRLDPFNYTDLALYISNSSCATRDKMHIFVNGVELTNYVINTNVFGLYQISYPFGVIKAGDIVNVTSDCGDTPSPYRIAGDVNYYIEVPDGINYLGNGITQSDTLSPAGRLDTPVEVKQCTEIPVNTHFLANFSFASFKNNDGSVNTSGQYKINGVAITPADVNALRSTPAISSTSIVNADGSISTQSDTYYYSNRIAGVPPYTIEYVHNGIDAGEKTLRMNGVGYAFIENSTYRTWKYNYASHPNNIFPAPTVSSSYKLKFTGNKMIWLVDNVKKDSVTYTVQYSIVGGSGTLSNVNPVEVGTPTVFIPTDTGSYALQATFSNGVVLQQKFHVTPNLPVVAPNVATIFSGNRITLTASGCSGVIHWGSPTSTVTGNAYQVSPLVTTTYTAYCVNTTGCVTLGTNVVVTVQTPKPTVVPNANAVCAGQSVTLNATGCIGGTYNWTGGLTGPSITVSPSVTTIYNATCTNAAGTSLPTPIKLTVN